MLLVVLTAALAAQMASGRVIARHGGHDEVSYSLTDTKIAMSRTTVQHSSSPYVSSMARNMTITIHTTETAFRPAPSNGSHAPYPNATSTSSGSCGSGIPASSLALSTPSTPTAPPTAPWLAWPTPRANNSAVFTSTMTTPRFSLIGAAPSQAAPSDPIIFDPGRLPSPTALTSTLHITVTASVPGSTGARSTAGQVAASSEAAGTGTSTTTVSSAGSYAEPPSSMASASSRPAPLTSSSLAARPSSMAHGLPAVHTTILSADPRCPYPFPGVYCGEPKTTLVTEARSAETSAPTATGGSGKPKETGWCPYPGLIC
ncbi:hypothetical protein C7974DRAFT_193669 [Boeremia exigua]|uniref:uncharacterized protein n=1 Tax=Boeremia exigua TaxID=749465 RepID=UPI001E8D81BE|nr:uncharacterized protein C7974DRAFT_193669 [Boeremia exigua]KAH6629814.1 hypothetical protein C7974DRAFT_193669 [Boeremia exigua]